MTSPLKTLGIIFMGGQGERLGGVDKSKLEIGGVSCFDRVRRVLAADVSQIAISQRSAETDRPFPVSTDWPSETSGSHPALALLGCLVYAEAHDFDQIVTTSVDTPFLPFGFTKQLQGETASSVAVSGDQTHGLHARWSCEQLPQLKDLVLKGQRGIYRLHQQMDSARIPFNPDPVDPFFNINTPENLEHAERLYRAYGA